MLIVPRVAESFWLPSPAADRPQTLLVDRQPLVLAAIASLLSSPPLSAEVRTVTRSDAALDAVGQFAADLVLCEVRALPLSGPDLASALAERYPSTKVVLLADEEDDEVLLAAVHSGATGFFTKESPSDEFVEGVRAVLAGHFVIARSLIRPALGGLMMREAPGPPRPLSALSVSERGILAMVGEARSIAGISEARGISRKTVRNHLSNIYRKLGVRNRTEAILCAARLGLINTDRPDRG